METSLEKKHKRYYVGFYDFIDGWGTFGFFEDLLFETLDEAIKRCRELQRELPSDNKRCGEHYGVLDGDQGHEIFCGLDEEKTTYH